MTSDSLFWCWVFLPVSPSQGSTNRAFMYISFFSRMVDSCNQCDYTTMFTLNLLHIKLWYYGRAAYLVLLGTTGKWHEMLLGYLNQIITVLPVDVEHTFLSQWLLKFARIVFVPRHTQQSTAPVSGRKFWQSTDNVLQSIGEENCML